MLGSPFQPSNTLVPEDADIVFVADLFAEDYVGGAELTTEALIESCPLKVFKVRCKDLSIETLESGHQKHWVFGNFSSLEHELIPTIVSNLSYSILEYDYKFCKYRSIEKHFSIEQKECDCHHQMSGKLISAFMYGAKSIWWMSESQQKIYMERFPFLDERENTVLSSVFDETFFVALKMLKEKYKDAKRKGWLVLGSTSWIKGYQQAEQWCIDNKKEYEVLWEVPYENVLEKMALAEGFVYLPQGGDTCPRMVIEAKLLGCELHINDDVQHSKEIWFDTNDPFDTEAYLYAARERFWTSIQSTMNYIPDISGYTTTRNAISQKYPFEQSIISMLGFCKEVIVVDGGSDDGTWKKLQEMSELQTDDRLKVYQVKRDWNHPRFAVFDGLQKSEARSKCTLDYCWQMDCDEIVHENDYKKIVEMCRNFPKHADLISLPVVEYWGSIEKVRVDVNPWKWRLSRNNPDITHGIPKEFRREDKDGNLYAGLGTDGCDYIKSDTFDRIPHASFYSGEIHNLRISALQGDSEALKNYEEWFTRVVELLPGVHHYSWLDIGRKISTYKNYWSKHWQSLYNIEQEDTIENNMFFNKTWSEVTEEDIEQMATKLSTELGGWVFHSKVDFSSPTPHISCGRSEPDIMRK
jgi:glycosyltransferase involved in cell wall biosynthesis